MTYFIKQLRMSILAALILAGLLLPPQRSLQAQIVQDPATIPFGEACAYLSRVKTFQGTFSTEYSNGFNETTTSGPVYWYTRVVQGSQKGNGGSTLRFYSSRSNTGWVGTPETGNGTFSLTDVANDYWGPRHDYRTLGDGALITGSQSINLFVIDAPKCRLGISIEGVVRITDNNNPNFTTGGGPTGGFTVFDVPIIRDGNTVRISGSASYPVYIGSTANKPAYFKAGGMAAIIEYYGRKGYTEAGSGSGSFHFTGQIEGDLSLDSVELQHENYPSREWITVGPQGTIDGNQVRMVAKINNRTGQQQEVLLDVAEMLSNRKLPNCPTQISVPPTEPGKPFEARCIWDTSGWAWRDTGDQVPQPLLPEAQTNRVIRVNFIPTGQPSNAIETPITVRPRPVFLVHGMFGKPSDWQAATNWFKQITPTWPVFAPQLRAGDTWANAGTSLSVDENAKLLLNAIEQVRSAEEAWHFDIVAHGYGGLVARAYIHYDMALHPTNGRPAARNLIMIGTPNQGTRCAAINLQAEMSTGVDDLSEVFYDQTPAMIGPFNQFVTNLKGTQAHTVAGIGSELSCLPEIDPVPLTESIDPVPLVPNSDTWVDADSVRGTFSGATYRLDHFDLIGASQTAYTLWTREVLTRLGEKGPESMAPALLNPAADSAPTTATPNVVYSQAISATVAANASITLPLDVAQAEGLVLLLMNTTTITGELLNPAGTQAAANSGKPMQRLQVRNPASGVWSLRLANASNQAVTVRGLVALNNTRVQGVAQAHIENGQLSVSVRLTDGQAPVRGATITGTLAISGGTQLELVLRDDGTGGDATADDGRYTLKTGAPQGEIGTGLAYVQAGAQRWMLPITIGGTPQTNRVFLPMVVR